MATTSGRPLRNPDDAEKSAAVRVIQNLWPGRIALEFAGRMAPLVIQAGSARGVVESAQATRVLHQAKPPNG